MKHPFLGLIIASLIFFAGCKENKDTTAVASGSEQTTQGVGQSGVKDDISKPNIVQTAVSNENFSTLVKAVQAAGLVDALSNAGPFTVFAPTNAAFDKLPKGTLDDLLKPENKGKLVDILGYHTYVGVLKPDLMQDGQEFDMVASGKVKITEKDGKLFVNNSEMSDPIQTTNGVIYVINDVLLPNQ
ncbi:MAG: fasciclin domain-containing protein [Flavobacteriaceae bacterium]|nr:fasciclin domain-containing protein [Flavobacteriaceae bacterium]